MPLAASEEETEDTAIDTASVEAGFVLLMAWLHRQAEFSPEMLKAEEVQSFIRTHAAVLDDAVDVTLRQRPLDDISVQRLKESNFVFSGYKAFHELNETFPSLLDADGSRKPFERFLNDVRAVNRKYNRQYLKAEYHFALSTADMAAKWQAWWTDEDRDRYLLQYRTVADKRVRESHRLMHNITLPITSRFWDWYAPPNGWNCRCTVARVRRGKYPETGEQEAMNAGSQSTAGKHQEMMRFNPGKQMACFPAYNAYTIKQCSSCPDRPGTMKLAKVPDNELCAACKVVREMQQQAQRKIYKQILGELKEKLVGKYTFESEHFGGRKGIFVRNSITENLRYGELFHAKVDVMQHIDAYLSTDLKYSWMENMKPDSKADMKGMHIFKTIYNGTDKKMVGKEMELMFEEFNDHTIKFHFIKFL